MRFESEHTKLFCLRVMVGVIILYDHVHPVGAFAKSSGIDVSTRPKYQTNPFLRPPIFTSHFNVIEFYY